MTAYPLGHKKPAFNDTYYYRNANKMVEVENHNNNLPAGDTPKAMSAPVLTEFAQKHVDLQRKLYLCLRANYHRFMDNACKTTIDHRIKTFESNNGLKGEERLDLNKRYTWTKMRNDMAALCCIATPTGFYFLPLYTTVREDNCTVHDWLISVLRLYSTLRTESTDWGDLAEPDAVHRMYAFLSRKEVTIIETHLQDQNRSNWNNCKRTLFGYLSKYGMETSIQNIASIAPDKFPIRFTAATHAQHAVESSLFTWKRTSQMIETLCGAKDREIARLKADKARLERELATARSNSNRRSYASVAAGANTPVARKRPQNAQPQVPASTGSINLDRAKYPAIADLSQQAWEKLCTPNKKGIPPCVECLKVGIKLFHTKCDPVKRQEIYEKLKDRPSPKKQQKAVRFEGRFPPDEKDRKFALNLYDNTHCKHCKREDVDPKFASRHPSSQCYRAPGGACDQAGADTRRQRNDVVREQIRTRAKQRANSHKTTTLAVRTFDTKHDSANSPRMAKANPQPPPEASAAASATTPSPANETTKTTLSATKRHAAHNIQPGGTPPNKKRKATVLRAKKFPFHDVAKTKPFTDREMAFALDHHRTHQKNQIRYQYYRPEKQAAFASLREACAKLSAGILPSRDAAHYEHTTNMRNLGFETKALNETPADSAEASTPKPKKSKRKYSDSESSTDAHDSSTEDSDSSTSSGRHRRRPRRHRRSRGRRSRGRKYRHRDRRNHRRTRRRDSRDRSRGYRRARNRSRSRNRFHAQRGGRGRGGGERYNTSQWPRTNNAGGRTAPPTRPTKTTTPQQRTKAKATVPPKANTPPPKANTPPPKADTPPPSPPPEAWPDSPSAPPSPPEDDTIVLPAPGLKPCTVTVGVQNGSESPTGPTQVETKPGFSCDVGGDSSDSPMASYEYSDDDDFTTCRSSGGVPVSTSRRKRTSTARSRITRRMTHAIKRTRTTYRMTHACTTSAQNEPRVTHARTTCTQELPYMYAYTQTAGRASTPCCGESPQEKTQYRESSSCQDSQGRQGQGQEVDPLLNLPGGQWLPARSQIYDRANMLNKKTTLNSVKPHTNTEGELLPSERKGLRLLQAIISYRDVNGVTKTGRVKLDTCSNGCYALPGISLPRPWRPWEPRSVQGIQGTLNALGNPTYFTLYKQGATVTIDTNDPLPGVLPDGCVALLGLDAIHDLGIDIAYAVKHQRHMPIKFISDQGHLVENRRNNAIKQYVEQGYVKESIVKTCNLSERVVKEYLRTHPNDYKSKTIDIRSVDIAIALSKRTQDKLRDLCKLYDMVFASNTNTLPPVLEGIKPHMFKMKEGAKPVYETRPAFPPAKAQAISE